MDTISYVIREADAHKCKDVCCLVKSSADRFTSATPPLIVAFHKLICLSAKESNMMRILTRHGKHTDKRLSSPHVRHLSSTMAAELTGNVAEFYAVGEHTLHILTASTLASGEVQLSVKDVHFEEEEIFTATNAVEVDGAFVASIKEAPASGNSNEAINKSSAIGEANSNEEKKTKIVFVLGTQHVYMVDVNNAVIKRRIDFPTKVAAAEQHAIFDFHKSSQLLLLPAKHAALLDIISVTSRESVLSKLWEPHGDAAPEFAHFFQHCGNFSSSYTTNNNNNVAMGNSNNNSTDSDLLLIVTSARGNRELRFWTFHVSQRRFALQQEINLESEGVNTEHGFIVSVTPSEEYITLLSRDSNMAVVVEVDKVHFKAHRLTSWHIPGPVLACGCYVGKFAENVQSQTAVYALSMIVRNKEGVYKCVADAGKLIGKLEDVMSKESAAQNWFEKPQALSQQQQQHQMDMTQTNMTFPPPPPPPPTLPPPPPPMMSMPPNINSSNNNNNMMAMMMNNGMAVSGNTVGHTLNQNNNNNTTSNIINPHLNRDQKYMPNMMMNNGVAQGFASSAAAPFTQNTNITTPSQPSSFLPPPPPPPSALMSSMHSAPSETHGIQNTPSFASPPYPSHTEMTFAQPSNATPNPTTVETNPVAAVSTGANTSALLPQDNLHANANTQSTLPDTMPSSKTLLPQPATTTTESAPSSHVPLAKPVSSSLHSPSSLQVSSAIASSQPTTTTITRPMPTVSSSLTGDYRATSAISESNAANLVKEQAQKVCEQVKALDSEFVAVQKMASNTMRLLQHSNYREQAQAAGRNFASRNKLRLVNIVQEEKPEPGMMTEAQRELIAAITNVTKQVKGTTASASSFALKKLLQRYLKQSVEKASKDMESLEVSGTASMNVSATNSASIFREALQKCNNLIAKTIKQRNDEVKQVLEVGLSGSADLLQRTRDYNDKLHAALRDTASAIGEVKETLNEIKQSPMSAAAAANGSLFHNMAVVPVDPDVLTARAVALAEQGDWPAAFTMALEASDITVLLGFLESKVCEEKHIIANSTSALNLPLFLSLCLQLTFMMNEQPSSIPLRVQLLHDFYLEWDDVLKSIKAQSQKDANHSNSFETIKRELVTVMEALNSIDTQALDRRNRSKCRLVIKLINSLTDNA